MERHSGSVEVTRPTMSWREIMTHGDAMIRWTDDDEINNHRAWRCVDAHIDPIAKIAKKYLTKDKGQCFHYDQDGHWERKCKDYLAEKAK
ncbi:hypothetical protein BHM03_00039875 [Ensete ventricosum]|nr:hypothetical protein BHM03_00039875 [Ensete ventricosum]